MSIPSECLSSFTDKLLVLQENKSKIIFENKTKQQLTIVIVDNCAIRTGLRCDYLVIEANAIEHFVELKGSDVEHAIKQLIESIKRLSTNPQLHVKHSHVVSTRSPLTGTDIQRIAKQLKKAYNSHFTIKNSPYTLQV